MDSTPALILLVEDNPDHAELLIRGFEDHPLQNRILHLSDGEAALDYLMRRGEYIEPEKSPRPAVVLLDLRLPKIDGLEVLQRIRSRAELDDVAVVILTTSNAELDVAQAYDHRANSFLVKPLDFASFHQLITVLGYYWLGWNQHPRRRSAPSAAPSLLGE
jgi:CheY-like chemotaxis protein